MLGASGIQAVAPLPSMPQKARWLTGAPLGAWKPLASAQVLGSRARSLDGVGGLGGASLTVTTICPAAGAFHVKETSSKSPGNSGRVVVAVPSSVPPAAGSPR